MHFRPHFTGAGEAVEVTDASARGTATLGSSMASTPPTPPSGTNCIMGSDTVLTSGEPTCISVLDVKSVSPGGEPTCIGVLDVKSVSPGGKPMCIGVLHVKLVSPGGEPTCISVLDVKSVSPGSKPTCIHLLDMMPGSTCG